MTRHDPRYHSGLFVAAASLERGCTDGMGWPPCRCASCVVYYTGHRLGRQYGHDRAVEILTGRDEIANADLAAWYRLGQSVALAQCGAK